jgi:hypothetical protein
VAVMTSFSASIELVVLGAGILLDLLLLITWVAAARKAGRGEVDVDGYMGIGSETGLLGGGGDLLGVKGFGGGEGDHSQGGSGCVGLMRKLFDRDWGVSGGGLSEPGMLVALSLLGLCIAVAGQMWMRHYLLHPQHLSDVECVVISSLLLLALAALTWALMGVAWSARKGSPDRVRAWAVVGSWALWGVMTSSLAMLMAWSGSSPSPQGKTIALSVTTQILFVFFLGACGETAMALHIQKQKHPSGTTPSGEPPRPPQGRVLSFFCFCFYFFLPYGILSIF